MMPPFTKLEGRASIPAPIIILTETQTAEKVEIPPTVPLEDEDDDIEVIDSLC